MARPPDWSALGLDKDPTPGDAEGLADLISSHEKLVTLATTIDDGITDLMDTAGTNFVGETADALREVMDKRLRKFVQTFQDAHQDAHDALETYRTVMVTEQANADAALTAAQGLEEDDPDLETHKTTAENARDTLEDAAQTAGDALYDAALAISSPIDECAEFWKFLTFFALALIAPALIFGGPVALLAIAVNAALLIHTAVEFANGNASVTELVLSIIGVMIPTTRGINITKLLSTGWKGIGTTFTKLSALTVDDMMRGIGKFTLSAVQFTGKGISWAGKSLWSATNAGLNALGEAFRLGGIVGVGALILSAPIRIVVGAWNGVGRIGGGIYRGLGGAQGLPGYIAQNFKGFGPIALILPVNATEMGARWSIPGLMNGLKLGVWNRGVFNNFRTGAAFMDGVPVDVRAIRSFEGTVGISSVKFAKYQPAAFAGNHVMASIGHLIDPGVIRGGDLGAITAGFDAPSISTPPPLSLSFADKGLSIGISDVTGPGLRPILGDMPGFGGGGFVTPPSSVVVHMPGADGRIVAVEVPVLPSRPGDATAAGGRVELTINFDSMTPIKISYGENGLTITTPGGGRMPAISVTTMPQLGEIVTVPSTGLSISHADFNPGATATGGGLGNIANALPSPPARLDSGSIALDLNLASAPPLRLHFADQGLSLSPPNAALPTGGALTGIDLPSVHVPGGTGQSIDQAANVAPHLPATTVATPGAGQLDVSVAGAPGFAVSLGEGFGHALSDFSAARLTTAPPATATSGVTPPTAAGNVAPPPVTSVTGGGKGEGMAGSLGDITLRLPDVAPVRLSSIEVRPAGASAETVRPVGAVPSASGGGNLPTPTAFSGESNIARGVEPVEGPGLIAAGRNGVPPPGAAAEHVVTSPAATVPVPASHAPVPPPTGHGGNGVNGVNGTGINGSSVNGSGVNGSGMNGAGTLSVPAFGGSRLDLGFDASGAVRTATAETPPGVPPITATTVDGVVHLRQTAAPGQTRHWTFEASGGAARPLGADLDVALTGKGFDGLDGLALRFDELRPAAPPVPVRDGAPVDGGTAVRFDDGRHLVGIGDGRHVLVGADGRVTHTATVLTHRPGGRPDLVVLTAPDGTLHPLPRGLDGVAVPDMAVRRTGDGALRVDEPGGGFSTFDGTTGRFEDAGRGAAGLNVIDPGDFKLLEGADRAAFLKWLGDRPVKDLPPLGRSDEPLTVFMLHGTGSAPVPSRGTFHFATGAGPAPAVRLDFDPATGRVTAAATDDPGITVHHAPDGTGDVITIRQGGTVLGAERWTPLGGDGFAHTLVRVDTTDPAAVPGLVTRGADGSVTTVPGAVTHNAALGGFRVTPPTGAGPHVVVDATGAVTHRGVPYGGVANTHLFAPVPGHGGAPLLLDAAGNPVPGATIAVRAADQHIVVTRPTVTTIHTPAGEAHLVGRPINGGALNGTYLYVPPAGSTTGGVPRLGDQAGGDIAGSGAVRLDGGGYRVTATGGDMVTDARGHHLGDAVALTGRGTALGEFVHVPAAPGGTPQLFTPTGTEVTGGVRSVGGDLVVTRPAARHIESVHAPGGALRFERFTLRGGSGLDNHRLVLSADGTPPRLETPGGALPAGAFVEPRPGNRFIVGMPGTIGQVDATGRAVDLDLALGGATAGATGGRLLRPAGVPATPLSVLDGGGVTIPARDIRIGAGVVEVRRGAITSVHTLDGALRNELREIRGVAGLPAGTSLSVPTGGGAATVVDSTLAHTPVGGAGLARLGDDSGFLLDNAGWRGVLDDSGQYTHRVVPLLDTTGADTGAFVTRPLTGPGGAGAVYQGNNGVVVAGTSVHGNEVTVPTAHGTSVHRADTGALIRETFTIRGGSSLDRHTLTVHANGTGIVHGPTGLGTPAVAQAGGGFRVPTPGSTHVVLGADGAFQHTAVPLTGRGGATVQGYVHNAAAGADLRGPGGAPLTGTLTTGTGPNAFTVTHHVTRPAAGAAPAVTHDVVRVYGPGGALVSERFTLHGGPFDGRALTVPANGQGARITSPNQLTLSPEVVPQANGGMRIALGDRHIVVDATGLATHRPVPLTRPVDAHGVPHPTTYALFDMNNTLDVNVRAADGNLVGGSTIRQLAGGDFAVTRAATPGILRFDGTTGAFKYETVPLTQTGVPGAPQQHVAVYAMAHGGSVHRAFDLLDQNFAPVADASVAVRVQPGVANPGFRATTPDGAVRYFDAGGNLQIRIGPADATNHNIRQVTTVNGAGATAHTQVIELSDGLGARFLRVDGAAPQLLDGEMTAVAHTGAIATPTGGGYRIDGPATRADGVTPSTHAGEYKLYDADGRLTEQVVNPVYRDQAVGGQNFKITYQYNAQGAVTGSWERWRGGNPPNAVAPLNDRGLVDVKGVGHGQVTLTTTRGGFVFESRPLPDGATLQAHTGGSVAGFVERKGGVPWGLTERERWQRVTVDGAPDGHGIRVWSPSRKTWMDYADSVQPVRTWAGPIRHFRETPDGGHVIAVRPPGARPLSYQVGDTATWHRYGPSGEHLATGRRDWNVFRNGWTDRLPDPRKGEVIDVHVKFGHIGIHNLRNFRAHQMAPDGTPKREWAQVSPQGKENAGGKYWKNGEWFENHRIAEQRPANFYRWALSSEIRATETGPGAWRDYLVPTPLRSGGWINSALPQGLRSDGGRYASTGGRMPWALDNRYQTYTWKSGDQHGVQLIASRGFSTVTVDHELRFVAETRPLTNGNTLTVGPDVTLPPGAGPRNNYIPWSEGAGKLEGHRTFDTADFAHVPPPASSGKTTADVLWQDRFTTSPGANWFSPDAAKNWHVVRMGFKDGTMLDFRPRAEIRADGAAGSGDLAFQRTVHADQGYVPPGQAAPPGYRGGDWVLMNHQGKIVKRLDTWPGAAPPHAAGAGEVRIVSQDIGHGRVEWHLEGGGGQGIRKVAHRNQYDHNNYFDRESYRDFDANNQLIREKHLLGDGTTVNAWKHTDAAGTTTWHWNKMDRHGNVMGFGNQADRVRVWFDGTTQLPDWRPGARFADRQLNPPPPATGGAAPPHVTIQELPVPVGSGPRQFFNDSPLRVREYAPTPGDVPTRVLGAEAYRAWKDFESGAPARVMERGPDGSYFEVESMAKHWRRYFYDGGGVSSVITERTIPGFVWERGPAGSFVTNGQERFWAGYRPDFHLAGRETRFIGFLNEFRGFERELRQPRRTPWGPAVSTPGRGVESAYTPFAVRNLQHMLLEGTQEFVLDFALNMAVYAALGPFSITDVQQAAVAALVSSAVKATGLWAHNWAAHRSGFRVGLNWQDRGFPYRFRQDDDDWAGEWAFNEFVLRWRGGTYDFFKDGFVLGPIGAFLGQFAAIEIFGVKDSEGNRIDVTAAQAAALAGAAALGTVIGSLSSGFLRTVIQNTIGARWYHRQGVIDFVVMPALTKMLDKSIGILLIGPLVRDWLNIVPPSADPDAG
ncbi:hypothetical protein [Streptomyces sp. NPDC049879]|uniref:hypothetical protein n=1 Tax=Streptomyces sp. NPDC049879 TaxID=3365598 RepID=UPI003793F78A